MDYRERWVHKEYLSVRRLDIRVRLLHAALLVLIVTFGLNFWYLQTVRGDTYAELAENNRLRRIAILPSRGVVVDRNERVIASTTPSLTLVLSREDRGDRSEELRRLAPILETSVEELEKRLAKKRGRPLFEPVVLKEDVGLEELAWIEARREWFPSVQVIQAPRRNYHEDDMVAHTLGHVGEVSERELDGREGLRPGDIVGKSGLERAFDDRLRGSRGWKYVSVNNLGRRVPGRSRMGQEPEDGTQLKLTLDMRLQRVLRKALGDEAGAGVFVDPRSGEVLAMVSTPTYDPNMFARGVTHKEWGRIQNDPRRPLHDRTIDSFYAPGSTFKVLMAVAGIETGEVTPDHRVFCNGSATYYGRRRLCWKRGGHGWVDLRKALAKSCNVYFYQLGKDMGIDEIHRYGWMFGLGQPSGASIPGEETGILPSREWKQRSLKEIWYPGDTISVSIGQGLLAVTPVQMVRMISTVATGGRRPDLRLVAGKPPKSQAVAVNPMTFKLVNLALEDAVNDGTAKTAAVRGIQVAGKTGTAQVFKHSAGIDADELPKAERDHAWLVGYAPSDHPTIAFAIVVEHGGHGGTSAAPIARDVLTEFFYPSEPATEEADESLRVSRPVGAGRIDGLRPPAAR